jgi:molybdopterin-guanine dinucleotide biosynthesis protein A
MPGPVFTALVLAGDRRADDPLVIASGAGCKALLGIAGRPMLLRVLDALQAAGSVGRVHLSGPGPDSLAHSAELRERIADDRVHWHAPGPTPSTSALAVLDTLGPAEPVLLTTADHPLLKAEYIEHFCTEAARDGADVAVGVAPYALVQPLFPDMRKTLLRFSDGPYCGCNLFAFPSPAGRAMAARWREVESARKTPWRVIGLLGWSAILRYRLGWMTLDAAMALLSRRTGLRVKAVVMPFGEAAVDVDSPEDHRLVEARLRARETS